MYYNTIWFEYYYFYYKITIISYLDVAKTRIMLAHVNLFIEFTDRFRPGSIVVLQVSLLPQFHQTIVNIQQLINQFSNPTSQFNQVVKELRLVDLERVLYRSSVEEKSDGKGFDVYSIPDYGKFVYSGLQGQISLLEKILSHNELKHP
jgi:hypothetical protein